MQYLFIASFSEYDSKQTDSETKQKIIFCPLYNCVEELKDNISWSFSNFRE